jgi:AcrR family transcriptional regulator
MLSDALVALMMEKRYNAITVQDIIDRADVGRSTFYAHFLDKEALLQHQIAQVVENLGRHMDNAAGGSRIVPSIELFRHLRDSRPLIHALVRGRAMETTLKTMHAQLCTHIETRLAQRLAPGVSPSVPPALLAHYVAGVLLSLLDWWMERDMSDTPEQMDSYFLQLVGPSVKLAAGIEM